MEKELEAFGIRWEQCQDFVEERTMLGFSQELREMLPESLDSEFITLIQALARSHYEFGDMYRYLENHIDKPQPHLSEYDAHYAGMNKMMNRAYWKKRLNEKNSKAKQAVMDFWIQNLKCVRQ